MIPHYLFLIFLLISFGYSQAQTTVSGSFIHGGVNRTYSFYVPASYLPGQAVPLVLNLHGFGSDGASQAENRDFRPIADTANFIVVHPDGTKEPITNQRFWNYGNIMGSTVDDMGFLEALIDTISAHYTINERRIYSAGMSNGSFMCYYLACNSNRFAAIGAVTGSMSTVMYNSCNPAQPIPTIHIHGTNDGINPYNGNNTMAAIEDVTLFWANQNGCNLTPLITPVADINTSDGATAERYLYTGGIDGRSVELFKVTGGGHTWPGIYVFNLFSGNTCMDFSASKEIWRFFSQYELPNTVSFENPKEIEWSIWPNPTQGYVYMQVENHIITDITIIDMEGRVVERYMKENIQYLDLGHLETGNYIVNIRGNDFSMMKKLTVLPRP